MRIILLFTIATMIWSCGTNRQVYKSRELEQLSSNQKIAVLPFRIVQTGHRPSGVTEADIRTSSERLGYVFQESLLMFMLRHTSSNRKGPMADFQSLQKTNALLQKAGLSIDDAYLKTPEELAQLLDVDAVLMTTLSKDKHVSDNLAYGIAVGQAVITAVSRNAVLMPGLNAADLNLNCSLYSKNDSKLLWKTFRQGSTDLPGRLDDLAEFYSNWIARKFPFRS